MKRWIMKNIVAELLVMHEPRRDSGNVSPPPGDTPYNPYTEYVIYAVIPPDPDNLTADTLLNSLIREKKPDVTEHTKDFLVTETALNDIHSLVRMNYGNHYRLSWDFATCLELTPDGPKRIDKHEFFNFVRTRVAGDKEEQALDAAVKCLIEMRDGNPGDEREEIRLLKERDRIIALHQLRRRKD